MMSAKLFGYILVFFLPTLSADEFDILDQEKSANSISFLSALASAEASNPSISKQNDQSLDYLSRNASKIPVYDLGAQASQPIINETPKVPSVELKNLTPLELKALETDIQRKQNPSFLSDDQNGIFFPTLPSAQGAIPENSLIAQATIDAQSAPQATSQDLLEIDQGSTNPTNSEALIGSLSGIGGTFAMVLGTGFISSLFMGGPSTNSSLTNKHLGLEQDSEALNHPSKGYNQGYSPTNQAFGLPYQPYPSSINKLKSANTAENDFGPITRANHAYGSDFQRIR